MSGGGGATALLDLRVEARAAEAAPAGGDAGHRRLVDRGATGVTLALLGLVGLGATAGPSRILLALVFVTFVPGWAVIGLSRVVHGISKIAVAVAASLTICTAGALAMVWLRSWHPFVLFYALGGLTAGVLVLRPAITLRGRRAHRSLRPDPWCHPFTSSEVDGAVGAVMQTVNPGRRRIRLSDVLLPGSLALWLLAVQVTRPDAMNDWGLLAALPVVFFVSVGLLVVSIGCALTEPEPSSLRLALHLVALVLVLHGTVPAIFPATNYPWAYKHMGVVGYINRQGRLDTTVDIYQNWPGFFAVAAWFDKVAGVRSPLSYAKWAPVYFNLLFCAELAFVLRWLPLRRRERWLGLFLFVAGNWVGQDYFAPQALAVVLSLAAYGMVLAWFHTDRRPAPLRWAGNVAGRLFRTPTGAVPPSGGRAEGASERGPPEPLTGWSRAPALVLLFGVFAVVTVSHQLSPYLVVTGVALMTVLGGVRPRWIALGLALVTVAYLVPHLRYLRGSHNLAGSPLNPGDILNALSNPLDNLKTTGFSGGHAQPGRDLTAFGAPVMILGLWSLAAVGAVRRLRAGRPALLLVVVAGSPLLLAFGQNYGGEAIFRIYLFSLPWVAALAAGAVAPRKDRWGSLTRAKIVAALAVVAVLFMSAFYGSVELYRVRPGSVAAGLYFYDHAQPGSVLGLGAPNFPGRVAGNYDQFRTGSTPPPLTTLPEFQGHVLGAGDIPALSKLYQADAGATQGQLYLALGADQDTYAEVLGFMPRGSLAGLDRALAGSPRWQVSYRNRDAVIYQFLPDVSSVPDRPGRPAGS